MLTDEQKQAIHNETGAGHSLICLVELAATAPLLAEIERLKAQENPEKQIAEALRRVGLALIKKQGGYSVIELGQIEAQASNAQAEPLALERLNAEEVRKAIIDEGMMFTAPDYRVAAAIQSAIAAKNGAKLK